MSPTITNHTAYLASQYHAALADLDFAYLDSNRTSDEKLKYLSGLFLTSVPRRFEAAKHKIMIIGSETAGWNVMKPDEEFTTLKEYIEKSMSKHQRFFERQLEGKNRRGFTFHNFVRSIAEKSGPDGLIYSNLFCFDWKNKSPLHCPCFETVKRYSERLLKIQIEFFRPDIIIFANGITSVPYRREFFPIEGPGQVCRNGRDYSSDGVPNHHLWEFQAYDRIRCFRIHHPSARAKDAAKARKFLIDLLP
jgi:hypothetical protein